MLDNLLAKSKIEEQMNAANDDDEKKKLHQLFYGIIVPLYTDWYNDLPQQFQYSPTEIMSDYTNGDSAGVYEMFNITIPTVDTNTNTNTDIDTNIDIPPDETANPKLRRVGMSMRCRTRTSSLIHTCSFKLMDRADVWEIINHSDVGVIGNGNGNGNVVDAIMDLQLPGLIVHNDHNDFVKDLIVLQLAEGFLACYYQCITMTILERLVELPSKAVSDAVAVPVFGRTVVDFVRCQQETVDGIQGLFGWPTLRFCLAEMAKTSNYLQAKLRPNGDKFVTLDRFETLFGLNKATKWIDCVDRCPRLDALEAVVSNIEAVLAEDDVKANVIRDALTPLQDENYSHYYPPADSDWGKNGKKKLETLLTTLSTGWLIWMERSTFTSIKKEDKDWLASVVDLESGIEVIPDDPMSCCLMKSHAGHKIIVSASHFTMFDPVSSGKNRFTAVQSFLTQLELMFQVGVVEHYDHVVQQRMILKSFLMRVDASSTDDQPDHCMIGDDIGDDETQDDCLLVNDDYLWVDNESLDPGIRRACRQALGRDYFPHPVRNVMNVSKSLKIGHMEMMYLRAVLGKEKTDKVLVAFGLLLNGVQKMSPLEVEYCCPGLPAVGRFPARACTANGDYPISMAGRYIEGHPLYGVYACQICIRSLARREFEVLSKEGSLTEAEGERLNELERQREEHRNHTRVNRTDGTENCNVRSMNRITQSKRVRPADQESDDGEQKPKKKSGENRAKNNGTTRPQMIQPIKSTMVKALRLFADKIGLEKIWWNHLVGLLDLVLKQEAPKHRVSLTYTKANGRVFYHEPLYRQAAKEAGLVQQKQHYIVSWFVDGTKPSGEKCPVLYQQVMESLN